MSTDRELLELAAKAVGINLVFDSMRFHKPYYINSQGGHSTWNPFTDDRDALRLAVKLGFLIYSNESEQITIVKNVKYKDFTFQQHEDDPYAATRRAIVRAAAEIGRWK
jgi:hypothetical protein